MPITIRDVAHAAGVSPMSVSKVLHGKGSNVRVSETTATAIRKAAKDLNYRPNGLARRFRSKKTTTLALVFDYIPKFCNSRDYFADVISSATRAAFKHGYALTLCPHLSGDNAREMLGDGRFDGLLWGRHSGTAAMDAAILDSPIPIAMIHTAPPLTLARQKLFAWDNESASNQLADFLFQMGHRHVAFLGNFSDETNSTNKEQELRRHYFCAAAARLGMDVRQWKWEQSAPSISEWCQYNADITAVVAWNEQTGITFLQAAASQGIAVPDDLSVVAFDSTPNCDHTFPPLTATHQPLEGMTFEAVDFLIRTIEGDSDSTANIDFSPRHFPARLDIRASVARPRIHSHS
jgi:LacI family transcriptional regulator